MPDWTHEQQQVIDSRGSNVLVSAGAGSGKTAVLVERIIGLITDADHGIDVDSLVVVTFTKAAAAEMKARIGVAISKALKADPDNEHLQKQQTLLHNAKISTIDSFCLDIVRNFFHRIDLSPDFRIADEAELKLLKEDVLDDMMEALYEEADPGFIRVLECFTPGKTDDGLKKIISKLHDFSMSYSDSEGWVRKSAEYYACENIREVDDNPAVISVFEYAKKVVRELSERAGYLVRLAAEAGVSDKWQGIADDEKIMLDDLCKCSTYSEMYSALKAVNYANLSGKHPNTMDKEKKDLFIVVRNAIKKKVFDLRDKTVAFSPDEICDSLPTCKRDVEILSDIVIRFMHEYSEAKRDRKIVDFNDIEHFALKILTNEDGSRSDVAKQFASTVHEIFIDEYQDSNGVQEDILRAVSGIEDGRYNIFMVGDIKQSIYRFRMAKPELFMGKYETYSLEGGPERRIDLHNNFRSRREVIESVNYIFRQLMHSDVGNVEYDKAAELVAGAKYPEDPGKGSYNTEFMILEPGENVRLSGYAKIRAEADMVALRIKKMVESGDFPVKKDDETLRPVRYGDIAILLRSAKGIKDVYAQALEDAGIPLKETSATGYFNAPEVMVTLSLLELIDNPMQDIPLAAVLRSPVCGLTSKDLAGIRALCPNGSFYRAVTEARKTDKRVDSFFEMLDDLRQQAVFLPVNELIELVVTKTGYLDFVSAMPGGRMRRENILMLMERASAYEQTSFKGLFNFLRYIDRMKKYELDFPEPESTAEYEDKVRIMTIHKSKGLEFPVVFLCGTSKQFNKRDNSGPIVLHSDMGVGIDHIDPEKRIRYKTIVKSALSSRQELEGMGEELRVLYVAMTRAKEKLIITAYTDRAERKMADYAHIIDRETEALGFSDIAGAKSFSDWIFMSLIRPCDRIKISKITAAEVENEWRETGLMESVARQGRQILVDPEPEEYMDTIRERFGYVYPFLDRVGLKSKMSVSELKKRAYLQLDPEEQDSNLYNEEVVVPYVPDFVEKKEEHAGIRRGNAYHAIMEHFDYGKPDLWGSFEDQLDGLVSAGFLAAEDKEIIYRRSFEAFFTSSLAERMKKAFEAGKLYREKPFVMSLPEAMIGGIDETVITQGIIDAYFIEDGAVVLVDYKTDKVDSSEELVKRYKMQLDLYEDALIRFTGLPVKEKIIYSFSLDKEIIL